MALLALRHTAFTSDAGDYVESSRLLLRVPHFVPYWPPGLPLYLLPFITAGVSDIGLRASMLFFWVLACWGLLRLAQTVEVGDSAWLILLVFALMPSSIHMSVEPLTQQPVAALLLIALSSAVRCGLGSGIGEFALLGCSLGAMSLMRPSALPLLMLLPGACLVVLRRKKIRHWMTGPLLTVSLGAMMVGGWMVKAHQMSGAWIINNSNAVNLFYGNNLWTPMYRTWFFGSWAKPGSVELQHYPDYEQVLTQTLNLPPLQASAEFNRLTIAYVAHRPDLFLLRTLNRMRCFWGFDTFTSANLRRDGSAGRRLFPVSLALEAALYLSIAGPAFFWLAIAAAQFWRQWQSWLIAGTIVVYGVPYWLSMSHPTYHYPVVMPLAVLGVMAWRTYAARPVAVPVRMVRGWVAVGTLAAIQVEWVWQMAGSLQR